MTHSQHSDKVRILLIAANPASTRPLLLQEEIRTIEEKIRAAEHRDSLAIDYTLAARPDDLIQAFQRYQPHIVHISGHGLSTGEILLLDQNRQAKPVSPEALKALFTALKDNIQLVFLNACYSQVQAEAIASVIDCTICMNTRITDDSAIVFAASVYRAIGFGRSLQNAFDIGKVALRMEGLSEHTVPQLICRPGVDPSQIYLIASGETPSADTPTSVISHSLPIASSLMAPLGPPLRVRLRNVLILYSVLLTLLLGNASFYLMITTINTACTAAPTLTRPVDGQTLNSRTVILTWEAPQGCLPNGYTVRITADYDPEAKPWIIDTGWAPTDYTHTFSADGTYYWHIRTCEPCTPFHPGYWATRSFTIHTSSIS